MRSTLAAIAVCGSVALQLAVLVIVRKRYLLGAGLVCLALLSYGALLSASAANVSIRWAVSSKDARMMSIPAAKNAGNGPWRRGSLLWTNQPETDGRRPAGSTAIFSKSPPIKG